MVNNKPNRFAAIGSSLGRTLEGKMAVDLYVYSPHEPLVTSAELREELRSKGWDVRFILDQGTPVLEPLAEGELTGVLDVMGWATSSDKGALAAEAIDQRDPKALQSLYDDGVVGTAGYSVESPFVFVNESEDDEDEDDGEDELDPVDQRFLEAIKQARTRYILRVRIRSSKQSFRFQNVLWEAIGRLTDVLLVDPQTAEIRQSG
jgi:hypothetical protein